MPTSRPLPLLYPARLRRPPNSFAWIDHRLRSDGFLQPFCGEDFDFYLFLVLAADAQGCSCWRLDRVERQMPWLTVADLAMARKRLLAMDLIAFRPWRAGALDGSYQVLSLPQRSSGPLRGGGPARLSVTLPSVV